jgi:hypothetical protein
MLLNQLLTRSQVNNCRVVPTTGLFDKLSYSECCLLQSRDERSCHLKRVVGTQLLLLSRDIDDYFGWCHTYRESVRNGQVANIFTGVSFWRYAMCRKWKMFVKCTSRRNETWNSSERESICKQWRSLTSGTVLTFISVDGLNKTTIKHHL